MTVTYLHPLTRPKQYQAANPINPDASYDVGQVQAWAGICKTTWYRLVKAGKAPPVCKIGGRPKVIGRDYIAWRDHLAAIPADQV